MDHLIIGSFQRDAFCRSGKLSVTAVAVNHIQLFPLRLFLIKRQGLHRVQHILNQPGIDNAALILVAGQLPVKRMRFFPDPFCQIQAVRPLL